MRSEARGGEAGGEGALVCALAGRRRRGASDNLSHKERKRKSAERKEGGGRERKPEREREQRARGAKKKMEYGENKA